MKVKLKDIGNIVTGKTPSTSNNENFDGNIPFITPQDVSNGYIVRTTKRRISQKGYNSIINNTISGISILVNCIGNIGDVAISNQKSATNQQINAITNIKKQFDYMYIYYKLSTMKSLLKKLAGQTVLSILPKSVFNEIEIEIPDISIQKKISKILSGIDNKIDNNNKINEELEQLAKTIYDYWFLQYEFPNEEGKPYKSSGGKMFWNDELKKEIPEGWKLKKIVEIEDNIVTGKTPSTKDETNYGAEIPFVTIDDIRKGMYISKTERTLSKKGADLQKNKYIPANSLCITCIATVGLVGITTRQSQTNQQINSIICKNTNNIYFLLNAIRNYFKFSTGAKSGNIFDNMNKEDFSNIKLIYPNKNIIDKYAQKVKPVYDKIRENFLENEELTSLRDYLLPLLMNGQVGFKN